MSSIVNQVTVALISFGILFFAYTWGRYVLTLFKLKGVKLNLFVALVAILLGLLAYFSNNLICHNKIASVVTIEIIFIIGIWNKRK